MRVGVGALADTRYRDLFGQHVDGDSERLMPRIPTRKRAAKHDPMYDRDVAFVWVDAVSGGIMYRGAYKRACIDDLHAKIPVASRRWMKAERVWQVDPQWVDVLLGVLRDHYAKVEEHTGAGGSKHAPPPTAVVKSDHDPLSTMIHLANDGTLKKIYRLIALDVHPDHGGSTQAMAELNTAWKQVCEIKHLA